MLWAKSIKDEVFDALRYNIPYLGNKLLKNIEISISTEVWLRKVSKELRKDMLGKISLKMK